jgi:hypothetical protein
MRCIFTFLTALFLTTFSIGQNISAVSPSSGERGLFSLPITISGTGTNFTNATSTAVKISQASNSLLEIINISSITPTSASINVRIPNTAPLGSYTVSVYDQVIGDFVNLSSGFTVLANTQPPTLVKTTPEKVGLNQVLPITITVDNANFSQATNNTIYLSQQGTSTLLYPVPGSIVALNNTHLRATFDFSTAPFVAGDSLNSHCGNSFDGSFTDFSAILMTASSSITGVINYAGTYNGIVELYQENLGANPASPNTYSLVASSPVIANSVSFSNLAEASYYLRSVPINMTDVVATYYPADISWQTATLVVTDASIPIACNITPVSSLSLPGGVTVNGTIGYGPNGFNKAQIVLAEGVEIFLKDYINNTYAQTVTDQNGAYSFSGIPNGEYIIVIDLPGYNQISTYSLGVTSASTNVNGVDFVIDDGEIFLSDFLNINPINVSELLIYPNPTSGELILHLPSNCSNAKVSIINPMGQVVLERRVNASSPKSVDMNVSSLNEGVYIVRVQGDQFSSETKLIKTK